MRVLRQRPVGGYFEIAGQFITDCPPNADADDPHRITHRVGPSPCHLVRIVGHDHVAPAEIAAECQAHCPRFVAVLRRERTQSLALAARLREWGISAVDVESTILLSKLVAAKLVELLIIDHHIEGFITGMEVVQKMRMRLRSHFGDRTWPECRDAPAGIQCAGPNHVRGCRQVHRGARESRPAGVESAAARSGPDSRTSPRLVERQIELPVLSQLIVRLVGYFQTPVDGIPFDDMCRDIAVDPKASVVLFKAANASANGLLRQISSVRDAIRLLGIRRSIGHILNAAIVDGMGPWRSGFRQRNSFGIPAAAC